MVEKTSLIHQKETQNLKHSSVPLPGLQITSLFFLKDQNQTQNQQEKPQDAWKSQHLVKVAAHLVYNQVQSNLKAAEGSHATKGSFN